MWFCGGCVGALEVSGAFRGCGGRGVKRYMGGGTGVTAWSARGRLHAFFRSVMEGTDGVAWGL